nr:MAG TPA: protein of unknown function (DUF1929) [Caudoviricetes sp.]
MRSIPGFVTHSRHFGQLPGRSGCRSSDLMGISS